MSHRRGMSNWRSRVPVLSTAGAVPVRTEKGEMYMEKVKVKRYVAGKRPDFGDGEADSDFDEEASEQQQQRQAADPFVRPKREAATSAATASKGAARGGDPSELTQIDPRDRRLQRLLAASSAPVAAARRPGGWRPSTRRIVEEDSDGGGGEDNSADSDDSEEDRLERHRRHRRDATDGYEQHQQPRLGYGADDNDEELQLDEAEIEQRRAMLRMRAKQREVEEDLMARQEEQPGAGGSSGGDSDAEDADELTEEEYTSDEDEAQPRLKPVFVRRRDRVTVGSAGAASTSAASVSAIAATAAAPVAAATTQAPTHVTEERRQTTLQLVKAEARQEAEETKALQTAFDALNTDDEDEEVAYETWKLRELKRLKRDREELEARQREQEELQRVRGMTEEERLAEFRKRPKVVTNRASKGKYKYLQKYYHRGAFYMDAETDILRRDVSQPTLEDHFDKSVLPKVMQVKNFGRAGRTKYTHLADQDTTGTDNPWAVDSAQAQRFHAGRGGGMRQVFQRPSAKRPDA